MASKSTSNQSETSKSPTSNEQASVRPSDNPNCVAFRFVEKWVDRKDEYHISGGAWNMGPAAERYGMTIGDDVSTEARAMNMLKLQNGQIDKSLRSFAPKIDWTTAPAGTTKIEILMNRERERTSNFSRF